MGRMAEYMEAHTPKFDTPDFHKKFGIAHKVSVEDYYTNKKAKEEELVFPIFTDYKMVSLN